MIKLNLLPTYLEEIRRIIVAFVIMLVMLAIAAGVLFQYVGDMKKQADWFNSDKSRFETLSGKISAAQAEAKRIGGLVDSAHYNDYINFFNHDIAKKHATTFATVLQEAANDAMMNKVADAAAAGAAAGSAPATSTTTPTGTPGATGKAAAAKKPKDGFGAWFTSMSIKDGSASFSGEIVGLMNFANYYFAMKNNMGADWSLSPLAHPADTPKNPTMNQKIAIVLTGKVGAFPTPPATPSGATISTWDTGLYPAGGSSSTAAGPAAGPAGPMGMPLGMPKGAGGGAAPGGAPAGAPGKAGK